ncbi:hypothetical protein KFZ56_01645 [Virgibacillus sp. NKC19-3]|uniref:hypothetical protein n=1 Tax=Virgibacillus saliphilus TaxID=2831674 RepID=UPI001C9B20EC|nr:hypothetical protein [Virgibacillus sp. NKC19-3]MBY7141818.1 hypothetical protein [Virgibacillus sp. NKC19-3]
MNRTNNWVVSTSAISGVLLGWGVKAFLSKRSQRPDYQPFVESVKKREKKLYADGRKRAQELERIKQEVHYKIEQ